MEAQGNMPHLAMKLLLSFVVTFEPTNMANYILNKLVLKPKWPSKQLMHFNLYLNVSFKILFGCVQRQNWIVVQILLDLTEWLFWEQCKQLEHTLLDKLRIDTISKISQTSSYVLFSAKKQKLKNALKHFHIDTSDEMIGGYQSVTIWTNKLVNLLLYYKSPFLFFSFCFGFSVSCSGPKIFSLSCNA